MGISVIFRLVSTAAVVVVSVLAQTLRQTADRNPDTPYDSKDGDDGRR